MKNSASSGTRLLARPKYNATLSMLRLDIDGNLRIYTYDENVEWGAWEVTYKLLNREDDVESTSECRLPKKCGSFGVCEDNQCVACPTAAGLLGWSKTCAPPILPACKGRANVDYYKVVGVEHFLNGYGKGGPKKAVVGAQANTVLGTTDGPKVNMVVGEVVASGTNDGVME
ncbi:Epidermis-specific secreted glycoprotein EP1 [Heracleum sosnowskyi]|uniref:Epidermis-specific secreted glycoprotein EP1 n=1 Tax=Heracleum sosnowskyi TaxID=360622 RepID=A0AAD8I4Z0_9APIA|nr:Epidermis-specific secreted glycoprotein EP1 [Heracleum sosnowskyi]